LRFTRAKIFWPEMERVPFQASGVAENLAKATSDDVTV
jgi:hypothetical protein